MALPLFRTEPIIAPQPPRLAAAPAAYEPTYQDQSTDILRLYFNQLSNVTQQLIAANVFSTTAHTVSTLPPAATYGAGARTFVSNALAPTFGATVAGGGTVFTPVYSDGTNWKVG
jgi:hypothetical protein